MLLLSAENLEKNFGERVLFSELNLGLNKGDKAALIAANGAGKSSLLKLLAGTDDPDSGTVVISQGIRIAYLEQEPEFDQKNTISQQIKASSTRIANIINNYQKALDVNSKKHEEQSRRSLEEATTAMDIAGAWDYDRKLTEMLERFAITETSKKISEMSGGQKKRLALALTLMDNPDLLLLDEPTNHLDIDMIEWLEQQLSLQGVSFLMVTHDRYFLDNVCNIIFELQDQKLYTHPGNYELFLKNKELREKAEEAEILKAKSYVKNELEWIRRMPKARTTKSKSRIDQFNETEKKAFPKRSKQELTLDVKMNRMGGKVLEIKNMNKSFGDQHIIKNFSYNFRKGERIGIIGANGSGKSTFLNLISGNIKPDSGTKETGETIIMAYYRQDGIIVDETKKVIEVVTDIAEAIETKKGNFLTASQFLQHFMFPPKVQQQLVSKLSGGEKRRLYLLTVLIKNPNFLILDEPTNDLDLLTLQKLEEFLSNFKGCIVIVSHDRFFLDKLCDHLFIFEGGNGIRDYYGPYTAYKLEKINKKEEEKAERKSLQKPELRKDPAGSRQRKSLSFKEKNEYENLAKELEKLESEKKELEVIINSGSTDYQHLESVSERIGQVISLIDEKEHRWLELDELNN